MSGLLKSSGTFELMLLVSGMATLNEVLTGTERVLDTPLPIAYTIAISQIAWIYILALPFQLYTTLEWVTIPGSIRKPPLHALWKSD